MQTGLWRKITHYNDWFITNYSIKTLSLPDFNGKGEDNWTQEEKKKKYAFVGWNMCKPSGVFENSIMKCFIPKGEKRIFQQHNYLAKIVLVFVCSFFPLHAGKTVSN